MESELLPELAAMRMGVDYRFTCKLKNFAVTLRPISNSEVMECYASVTAFISGIPVSRRTKIDEDNFLAREFLKKACMPFGSNEQGKFTDAVLDEMTNEEIMYFYKQYIANTDRVNPSIEEIPRETIELAIETLKKSLPSDLIAQLTELSFGQLVNLVKYFVTSGESPTDK